MLHYCNRIIYVIEGFNYIFPSHDHEIYDYWPKLGVALSFIITILCLLAIPMGKRQDWSVHQTRLSLCLMFCTCCIRQCEENIIDCMLREGAFIPSSNKMLDAWLPGFHCDDELVRRQWLAIRGKYSEDSNNAWIGGCSNWSILTQYSSIYRATHPSTLSCLYLIAELCLQQVQHYGL